MKPIETQKCNLVYKLPGGTEDNDLPCERVVFDGPDGTKFTGIRSYWELQPQDVEIVQEAGGQCYFVLTIYSEPIPPVALSVEPIPADAETDVAENGHPDGA